MPKPTIGTMTTAMSRRVGIGRKLPLGQVIGQSAERLEIELFTT